MPGRLFRFAFALFALGSWFGGQPIAAAADAQCPAVPVSAVAKNVDPAITAVFSTLESVWRTKAFTRMRGLWLTNLGAPLYVAEENPTIVTSWDAFDAYFAQTSAALREISSAYRIVAVLPGAPGQQIVAFELDWSAAIGPSDPPVAGSVRGQAILEREADEWKLRSYVEAPLAPIVYIGELYKFVACTRSLPAKNSLPRNP